MNEKYKVGSVHCNKFKQEYIITERLKNNKVKIMFLETKYEAEMFTTNNKTVLDRSHEGLGKSMRYAIGDILINTRGEKAKILDYRIVPKLNNEKRYEHLLRFLDTGYEVWADCYNFTKGKTLDRLKPTVCGIGCIGNPPPEAYPLKENKEYKLWSRMMFRCSESCKNEGYKNVSCSKRWTRFDFFYEDVKDLINYDLWKKGFKDGENNIYEIDKDILIKDNKVYSKETCMFVEKKINAGFTSWQSEEKKKENRKEILKELGIDGHQ